MKKKITIYALLAFLSIGLQSCLFQEENNFEDSSANRASKDVKRCSELLKNAPNGWLLEYYSGENYSMGGISLLCKFDGKKVSILSEIGSIETAPSVEVSSLYKVVSEQSTLLTFDGFNELIHCFSEPIFRQNDNFKGDYEFVIMSASETKFVLQGKKFYNYMVMTPIPESIDPKAYIASLHKIKNEAFFNNYTFKVGGQKAGEAERNSRVFSITLNEGESIDVPFIYTPEGFHFREPVIIKGKTFQNFKWNKTNMSFICTDEGAEHITIEGYRPDGYQSYDSYVGFYFFNYKTIKKVNNKYVFVDAEPFVAQLKTKIAGESYILSGSKIETDITVVYEKAIGKLVIKPQRTFELSSNNDYSALIIGNNQTIWLLAHTGVDFGYISPYVGMDYGLVAEKSLKNPTAITFVEYGTVFHSLAGSPATSVVATVYNSKKFTNSSFLGYSQWFDSIELVPYK